MSDWTMRGPGRRLEVLQRLDSWLLLGIAALCVCGLLFIGSAIVYEEAALEHVLSPRHFVEIRKTHGGPSPERTTEAIARSRQLLAEDQAWWRARRDDLATAAARLKDEVARL